MLERLWRGWTTPEDADAYERLLREESLPEIGETVGEGYRGHRVLRRVDEPGEEVEFLTAIRLASMADARRLTDGEPQQAHVPEEARALLTDWERTVTHLEVRAERIDREADPG